MSKKLVYNDEVIIDNKDTSDTEGRKILVMTQAELNAALESGILKDKQPVMVTDD